MRYLTLIAALAATTLAAPTPEALRGSTEWTPTLAGYFDLVYKHIQDARGRGGRPPTCDLSKASLPVAPTPLEFPSDYILEHVAIGRGTQVSRHVSLSHDASALTRLRTILVPMPQQHQPRREQ